MFLLNNSVTVVLIHRKIHFDPETMAKLSATVFAALLASAAAFAPAQKAAVSQTALKASDQIWDPLSLAQLGKNIDTFPGMFPDEQFLKEAEIKHGRQAMLAWTGVWATSQVRTIFCANLGRHWKSRRSSTWLLTYKFNLFLFLGWTWIGIAL